MKKLIYALLFIFFFTGLYAQRKKADSLLTVSRSQSGEALAQTIMQIAADPLLFVIADIDNLLL